MEFSKSEIKLLIDKLSDRYNSLPDGPLHPLDVDLILSILRQLYEKTESLRNQPSKEVAEKAEPVQYNPPAFIQTDSPLDTEIDKPYPATPVNLPVADTSQTPVHPEIKSIEQNLDFNTATPEVQPAITNDFKPENEFTRDSGIASNQPLQGPLDLFGTITIADKLKNETPSLKDKITFGKQDQTLADRIQLKPLHDLKTAIGLNDKFQFINELFEGSADRYNEAITLLNTCSSGSEAHQLIADLSSRYNWDIQNTVYMKLKEFVARRYL